MPVAPMITVRFLEGKEEVDMFYGGGRRGLGRVWVEGAIG